MERLEEPSLKKALLPVLNPDFFFKYFFEIGQIELNLVCWAAAVYSFHFKRK